MTKRTRKPSRRERDRQTVRQQGACLFCGHTGEMTHEHLFGDWVRELGFKNSGWREIIDGDDPERRTLQRGGPFTKRLRIVCDPCNTIWMSGMESAVKPHLVNMFRGGPIVPLDEVAQLELARWAFKTIAVASQLSSWKTFPLDHCRDFQQFDLPPENSQIWIGSASVNLRERLQRVADISYDPKTFPATSGGRTVDVPCYSARFRLLTVLFEIFGCQPDEFGLALQSAGLHRKLRRVLLPIWPSKRPTIWWPPLSSTDLVGGVRGLAGLPVVDPDFGPSAC